MSLILKLKFGRDSEAEILRYLKAVTSVKELYPLVRYAFDNVFPFGLDTKGSCCNFKLCRSR